MLRSKFLVKNFVTCNKILLKCRISPSIFASGIVSFSCLSCQKLLYDTRNDIRSFKKVKFITNVPAIGGGEKCFSKISNVKCWKCEQYLEVKNFACVNCGALQHPKKKINYFELFGLTQKFDIDLEELSQKFKKLQTVFHPDKYAGKTKAEKDLSETYSKLVNKAYSTLKDPFLRGQYLLALQKHPDFNAPLDQEFLNTVMGKNEELEYMNTESDLKRFLNEVREETETYVILINQGFKTGNFFDAQHYLSKLNYYRSMNNRAKEKINELQEKKNS